MRCSLRGRPRRSTIAMACLATAASLVVAAPAEAGNRVTPGNFTGYGFDQCIAPTQSQMDVWLTTSQFWAVGIYIAGASRACPVQPNLTPSWVTTQLRKGWRLLPLTVGPQAACQTRYRKETRISDKPAQNYAAARGQGRREATKTVRSARALGISKRSTLWYDIEAFSIANTRCRDSALNFLSAWTRSLHEHGYVSGVYSSAASGIKMLDDAARPGTRYALPDRIWIADWNGRADIYSSYIRSNTWMPHRRVHQYRGGHPERHGGVTINIDSNFMSLGRGSVARRLPRACGVGIDLVDYHTLGLGTAGAEVQALKCLLKRKGVFDGRLHRVFNKRTARAVLAFQAANNLKRSGVATLPTWTAMLSGGTAPILKYGSAGDSVRRLQRALNAAVDARLDVSGVFTAGTLRAVREYQQLRRLPANGVVAAATWTDLKRGRINQAPAPRRARQSLHRSG